MTKTIYVAGYPKSGTTWLTRLLGDALDCPTGGSTPKQDKTEPATEGKDRPGEYIIRKGHFMLFEGKTDVTVPSPHKLAWKNLTEDEFVVFLVRDPRDIVVSGAHHWKVSPEVFLSWMCRGTNGVRLFGPWRRYINRWLDVNFTYFITSYELLKKDEMKVLISLFNAMSLPYDQDFVSEAVDRQEFAKRKRDIEKFGEHYPLGRTFNMRFMRKGVVGDWKTVFTEEMNKKAQKHFGTLLETFGYE